MPKSSRGGHDRIRERLFKSRSKEACKGREARVARPAYLEHGCGRVAISLSPLCFPPSVCPVSPATMKSIAELLDGLFVSTPSSTRRSTHTLSSHQMTATSSSGSASSSSASTSTCTSASSSSSASLEAKCPAYPTTSYGALYSEQDEQKREAMIVEHRILLHNLHACGLLAKSSLLRWEKHVERVCILWELGIA